MEQAARAARLLLVVEDNDVEREGLAKVLRAEGFEVREAITGDQALATLRANQPDVILLDLLLPESNIDGWALLDYIRQNTEWQTIPVIVVTGLGVASFEWCTAHGALDIVKKPINADELLAKIRNLYP